MNATSEVCHIKRGTNQAVNQLNCWSAAATAILTGRPLQQQLLPLQVQFWIIGPKKQRL
jgi:hypothetical protein